MSENIDKLYDKIKEVNIILEMKIFFLNYVMSVIVFCVFLNVKDGLKLV